MASSTIEWIDEDSKTHMRNFYNTLSEKDKRRYAAVEAKRLGHGGSNMLRKSSTVRRKPSAGESENSIC